MEISDRGLISDLQDLSIKYSPQLLELRRRILTVIGVFCLTALITGFQYRPIITFMVSRFDLEGINMVLTSPNQVIELAVQIGILSGLVFTSPVFLYFFIDYLRPALSPKELRLILRFIPFSFILFIIGFSFGIWVMQFVIAIFAATAKSMHMTNIWDISTFLSSIMWSGITLGFLFQFPIILTILIKLNLINTLTLRSYRPYIYALILLIAALLPPTDLFSLIFLTIPLFFLFESTLLLNEKGNRNHVSKLGHG